MPIEKSAGAIVFRRNEEIKYLLIQYQRGHWEFPRGLIEKGESLEDTARREIKEEVAIKEINLIPGFKEWIKFFFKGKEGKVMKIVTFFLAQTETEKVKLSYEHKNYLWLPYQEAINRLTFKESKGILRKANDFLSRKSF